MNTFLSINLIVICWLSFDKSDYCVWKIEALKFSARFHWWSNIDSASTTSTSTTSYIVPFRMRRRWSIRTRCATIRGSSTMILTYASAARSILAKWLHFVDFFSTYFLCSAWNSTLPLPPSPPSPLVALPLFIQNSWRSFLLDCHYQNKIHHTDKPRNTNELKLNES